MDAGEVGAGENIPLLSVTGPSWAQMSRPPGKQSPPAPRAPPYHVRVVVAHVDPLASREPGLVLKHLFHEAQVARIGVMKQAVGRGGSEPLPKRSPAVHNPQQSTPEPEPTFLCQPHPN